MDYYLILEIPRHSSQEQIKNAFKRLSIKFNPAKNPSNAGVNQARFDQICEAYEVLSNQELRGVFDKHGEYGLKNGVTNHLGQTIGGYTFLFNSEEIFDTFFGTYDPLHDEFELDGSDVYGSFLGDGFGGLNQPKPSAPKDIEIDVKCTISEFYNGSMKTVNYVRD